MKYIKISVRFESDPICLAEDLISEIFFSRGLSGVECVVPLDEPDEGFGRANLPPPAHCAVTGYLPFEDDPDPVVREIRRQVRDLAALNIRTSVLTEIVDETDWAEAWKDHFHVTRVTGRITVKPQWRDHVPKPGEVVIHLDPGMAFGTGTHPTTAMCLAFMEAFVRQGGSFLDVGTGSGILMIAASRLGAESLLGIDTDETAVAVARENLDRNGIHPDSARLSCTTLDRTAQKPYDLIAANILARVIIPLLPEIAARMNTASVAILSGIVRDQVPKVVAAAKAAGLTVIREAFTDEWVCLAVRIKDGLRPGSAA